MYVCSLKLMCCTRVADWWRTVPAVSVRSSYYTRPVICSHTSRYVFCEHMRGLLVHEGKRGPGRGYNGGNYLSREQFIE